ncbi:hypothetical protein ACFPGO_06235 [Arcanobacterium canis]|uniref:Uncharacterized protein n=1 Tax=Arcanobacterium canis TaxID=999183 RepID=A0ABY8FZI7_9ACTO|nr:hypothetical protein [Arcanobacterium canis]WFM83627.1 hypothetical protein P7079_01200 [Arcanobacterium canis]
MGFTGFAIAVAVFLLLGIVVPRFALRRSVIADSPLEERFSEDLRIVRQPRLAMADSGESGTIYMTERMMDTRQRKISLKEVARGRSKARARMATRGAYRARGYLGLGVLGVVALAAWIGVGVASWPTWPAIVLTLGIGAGSVGFGYLLTEWAAGDDIDREEIAKASQVLARAKRQRDRVHASRQELEKIDEASQAAGGEVEVPVVSAEHTDEVATANVVQENQDVVEHRVSEAERRPAATVERGMAQVEREVTQAGREVTKVEREVARVEAPSYTLKRRTVAPYQPQPTDEAQVPYRPKRAGERIGDAPIEAPNTAPEMTGLEELRSGLLAGGSTLDELLAQRRA